MSTLTGQGASTHLRRVGQMSAVGALAGQISAAIGSFALQILAARTLGATGLGTFAFLYGALIMATALSSGLIGDTLTVLDRHEPRIRSALWQVGWTAVTGTAVIGFLLATHRLSTTGAVWFALALATFMIEDLGRRLLMATLHFWSLVPVDVVAFVVSMGVLGACALNGPLQVEQFLAAITIGQAAATVLAIRLLPATERSRIPRVRGGWRPVLGFGLWRAAQQFVRPTMLNAARAIVLVAAGTAAVGQLEAARILVAPALVMVQGLGSYLFSSYAADRHVPTAELRDRADRAALILLGSAVLVGGVAGVVLPTVGGWLTGGRYTLSLLAVLGWACYAASVAAVLPYGSLAAVRGRQQWLLLIRIIDSVLSLAIAAVALLVIGTGAAWLPWLLSIGSFVGGLLCRQVLLGAAEQQGRRAL